MFPFWYKEKNNNKQIYKSFGKEIWRRYEKPVNNYLDVKVSYACNFKCEYCYQADKTGKRMCGTLSKENADNLLKFVRRLNEPYNVTLAGGEPFVYPHLQYLGEKLTKMGHEINIITNFSMPFEKIEQFVKQVNISAFSISVHLTQWPDMEVFYQKLQKLVAVREKNKLKFRILLTCVLTENNFEKVKQLEKQINQNFDLPLEIQRVYYDGVYAVYSPEIEEYMKQRGLDVPVEKANHIDFFGRRCWTGSKFFYIEHNGDVQRCYTSQKNDKIFYLGNLEKYKKIKFFSESVPCLSADCGNCVCYKHFIRQKFILDEQATKEDIEKAMKIGHKKTKSYKLKFWKKAKAI